MREHRQRGATAPGRVALLLAALLLVPLLTAGCGGESDDAAASDSPTGTAVTVSDLDGQSYTSITVSGHELVDGTTLAFAFEGETLAVSSGCNTMTATYALADGVLRWTEAPAATLKACSAEMDAQDAWLSELLTKGMEASGDSTSPVLTADDAVIELQIEENTDLTSLLNKKWTVVATMDEGAARSTPRGLRNPTLTVGSDGLSRLFTGCNAGRTTVRVQGESLVFGPTTTTRQACPEPERTIQGRVLAVLDGTADSVTTEGQVLIVTKGQDGLVFSVE